MMMIISGLYTCPFNWTKKREREREREKELYAGGRHMRRGRQRLMGFFDIQVNVGYEFLRCAF